MSPLLNRCFLILSISYTWIISAQKPICGNEILFSNSPSIEKISQTDKLIEYYLSHNYVNSRSEIIIPVVVHIVWKKNGENVSDALVLSQIEALNRDFNANNIDIQNVPNEFKSVIGNVQIRFCLAAFDPNGNPSTGIVRVKSNISEIGLTNDLYYSDSGGSDAWDSNKYLNFWVANTGNQISGFGTYPTLVIPEKSGVVIHPKYFGINNHPKYGLGRVATHEVGHYLGLKHLWADDLDCNTDDDVNDTPKQQRAHINCPSYPQTSCSESEMFMNFMDYVDDPCMFMFTKGQKDRIVAVLNTFRNTLLSTNTDCINLTKSNDNQLVIFPNPSNGNFTCSYLLPFIGLIEFDIFNIVGQVVMHDKKLINNTFSLNFSSFIPGIYLLKIGASTYKLIKT